MEIPSLRTGEREVVKHSGRLRWENCSDAHDGAGPRLLE